MTWKNDQQWESEWWGSCVNTFNEEYKQLLYARLMGLSPQKTPWRDPEYDLNGKSVIDIGGGPVSMLLKSVNFSKAIVVDPCNYPQWVKQRYNEAGIDYYRMSGEDLLDESKMIFDKVDEVWIYNVLQHTKDPEKIIKNAKTLAKTIRIFEWVDTRVTIGHPHVLKKENLDKWLDGPGKVEFLDKNNCYGKAYFGVFNYRWTINGKPLQEI